MTTSMTNPGAITASLYDVLSEAPPVGAQAGETKLTATKETVDADTEDVRDDDVIYTRGA
jgi:hypothetical protein